MEIPATVVTRKSTITSRESLLASSLPWLGGLLLMGLFVGFGWILVADASSPGASASMNLVDPSRAIPKRRAAKPAEPRWVDPAAPPMLTPTPRAPFVLNTGVDKTPPQPPPEADPPAAIPEPAPPPVAPMLAQPTFAQPPIAQPPAPPTVAQPAIAQPPAPPPIVAQVAPPSPPPAAPPPAPPAAPATARWQPPRAAALPPPAPPPPPTAPAAGDDGKRWTAKGVVIARGAQAAPPPPPPAAAAVPASRTSGPGDEAARARAAKELADKQLQ